MRKRSFFYKHFRTSKNEKRTKSEQERIEKKIPSVGQVQALADKMGKHYGEVSRMLATGELTYEW